MQRTIYSFILFLVALSYNQTLSGQIFYQLDLLEDGETYQISIIPNEDWGFPNNLTSTGQVTIKVPTLEFEIADFESVQPQFTWEYNSRVEGPNESFELDYLSFGLKSASRQFEYEAGEAIPIIRFKNVMGCSEFVSLLDNNLDPVEVSTSRRANVGNQLTVLGAKGNAYAGNQGQTKIKCEKFVMQKEEVMEEFLLFPNPASNEVNLTLDWTQSDQEGFILIRDNMGKVVVQQAVELRKGFNEMQFDISQLEGGIYHVELSNSYQESVKLDRFVKINSASLDPLPFQKEEETNKKNPRN